MLSERAASYVDEMQLALKYPNVHLQRCRLYMLKELRASYEALDDMEKVIFLDIACFFNEFESDEVESLLDDEGSFAN